MQAEFSLNMPHVEDLTRGTEMQGSLDEAIERCESYQIRPVGILL